MADWTIADIPRQSGKLAVVTGATGGLGYETALALAGAGATVVLAGRSDKKGHDAIARIRRQYPQAAVRFARLDLASQASVTTFAERLLAEGAALDLLINNAGVMAVECRQVTADGFELQFATNYLGHFALTARLLPLLQRSPLARVVSLSSNAHRQGTITFDDLQLAQGYGPWKAYGQSKLAMLLFALELQRRSDASRWGLLGMAAHPGYARTELVANGPAAGQGGAMIRRIEGLIGPLFGQSAAAGALPTLFAATAPQVRAGGYYGPGGWAEMRGAPAPATITPRASDSGVAAHLWERSVELTGVDFRG